MNKMTLKASRREIIGKQVKGLRRLGVLPANLYGPHTPSMPIQMDGDSFQKVYRQAGRAALITLDLEGKQHPVLIKEVHRVATTGQIIHVDLFAVAMTERLRAAVPIMFVGEAPAAKQGGVLLRLMDALEVESLPGDLPQHLAVDLTKLEAMESGIHVRDIISPRGVTILAPDDELVVKVAAPAIEEVVAPAAPAPIAEETAAPETPTTEERQAGT